MASIGVGDAFILHLPTDGSLHHGIAAPGHVLHHRCGSFHCADFVGASFGTLVKGVAPRKGDPPPLAHVLRVTPSLWTDTLPHRTQIIYHTDASLIVGLLELKPGSTVAEAGTGSGSLTHALAQAVRPNGKVFTNDFNKVRVAAAADEFRLHGLQAIVVGGWRDVCSPLPSGGEVLAEAAAGSDHEAPGLGLGVADASLDAVFLDVPSPWSAVGHVASALKSQGRFCSFSPCIEQTQRLCDAARASGQFQDLRTIEVLSREYHVTRQAPRGSHDGAATVGAKRARASTTTPPDDEAVPSGIRVESRPVGRGHTAFLTFCRRR